MGSPISLHFYILPLQGLLHEFMQQLSVHFLTFPVWFASVCSLSSLHIYKSNSNKVGLPSSSWRILKYRAIFSNPEFTAYIPSSTIGSNWFICTFLQPGMWSLGFNPFQITENEKGSYPSAKSSYFHWNTWEVVTRNQKDMYIMVHHFDYSTSIYILFLI